MKEILKIIFLGAREQRKNKFNSNWNRGLYLSLENCSKKKRQLGKERKRLFLEGAKVTDDSKIKIIKYG